MVNAFPTLSDVTLITISPNVPSAQSDTLSTTEYATEPHFLALEELTSTLPLGLATKLMTSAENGVPTLVFVQVASALGKKLSMENASPWHKLVLKDNSSMLLLIVLILTLFARLSKKLEEDALNVFGGMNLTLPKENVWKLSAQPDSFPMISEDVWELATFAINLMPEETVWPASQPTLFQQTESASNLKPLANVPKDNIWATTTSATKSANSVKSTAEKPDFAPNVSITISSCTPENVSSKNNADPDKSLSTTTATTSAQPVETLTEQPESALTVPLNNTNYISDFAFLSKHAASDNGQTTMEFAETSTKDVTLSTHRLVIARVACKDSTSWTEFAVWEANSTKTGNVLMLRMPQNFQTKTAAGHLWTESVAWDATTDSEEFKTNLAFISAKLYDSFTFIFLIKLNFLIYLLKSLLIN